MRAYRWLQRVWYGSARGGWLLLPLAWLFAVVAALRRGLYRSGLLPVTRVGPPVVVVGNLTAGGAGKTPLIIWLAKRLTDEGFRVGIASRGYGSRSGPATRIVDPSDGPGQVGDEPLMMARRGLSPVAVSRRRAEAARLLVELGVDLILCDDGLQHYALARDYEIAVVDGVRRFGNGRLLPAGPLREPTSRLARVDRVVCNGCRPETGQIGMHLIGDTLHRLGEDTTAPLSAFRGRRCHGVAGIGDPERFFSALREAGVELVCHPLPDHGTARFDALGIEVAEPVLMTEKDAVKYTDTGPFEVWYLPVEACVDEEADRMIDEIKGLCSFAGPRRGRS